MSLAMAGIVITFLASAVLVTFEVSQHLHVRQQRTEPSETRGTTAPPSEPPISFDTKEHEFVKWVPLSAARNSGFVQKSGMIYFGRASSERPGYLLEGADSSSFQILETGDGTALGFAKDETHVYDGSAIIPMADSTTFTLLLDSDGNWTGFEADKSHVYFSADVVTNADPKTFIFLGKIVISDIEAGAYAKDERHVYFVDLAAVPVIITAADAPTFHLVMPFDKGTAGSIFVERQCGQDCYFDAEDAHHKYYLGRVVQ
jgi:hypothetical protein